MEGQQQEQDNQQQQQQQQQQQDAKHDEELVDMDDFDPVAYLEERGLCSAPEAAFAHVEASLDSGVREDMIVEMPVGGDKNADDKGGFWLARIAGVHGPLLRLEYVGLASSSSRSLWHDLSRDRLYPLGWCQMNRIELSPPECVRRECPGWEQVALQHLEDVSYETISMHHIDGEGVTPVDRIRAGMRLELRSEGDPFRLWPVEVVRNEGGMLRVRYCSTQEEEGASKLEESEETLFYTSERLFPWKHAKDNGKKYEQPPGMTGPSDEDSLYNLLDQKCPVVPPDLLTSAAFFPLEHGTSEGDLVEVLLPLTDRVELGKVTRRWDDIFFEVTLVRNETVKLACNSQTRSIFPLGWWRRFFDETGLPGREKVLERLEDPDLLGDDPKTIETQAPVSEREEDFEAGQKLEVFHKRGLRSATIKALHGGVLAIELDSDLVEKSVVFAPGNCSFLFPFMWGHTNGVRCLMPKSFLPEKAKGEETKEASKEGKEKEEEEAKKKTQEEKEAVKEGDADDDGYWCSPIYFNYQCYSASFLSKARLAGLPKSVGPGSVYLVMKKVLELIIGSSYKSGSVLKRLECREEDRRKDYVIECLKGKSRVHNLKANIEIPTRSSQVGDFCREVCRKLGACPNLISLSMYDAASCPSRCQFKSKSSLAELAESESRGVGGRGRKGGKKRRHHFQSLNRENSSASGNGGGGKAGKTSSGTKNEDEDGSSSDSGDVSDETTEPNSNMHSRSTSPVNNGEGDGRRTTRRPAPPKELPRSRIRTRGAKLPDFKLHLKICPSKEEQKVIESNSLRGGVSYGRSSAKKSKFVEYQSPSGKRGPGGWRMEPAFKMSELEKLLGERDGAHVAAAGEDEVASSHGSSSSFSNNNDFVGDANHHSSSTAGGPPPIRRVRLSKNPELWTCEDTAKFLAQTPDCCHLAHFMLEDEIDGHSFMLLNYPTVKDFWSLTVASAIRLCRHIESVKLAFYHSQQQQQRQ